MVTSIRRCYPPASVFRKPSVDWEKLGVYVALITFALIADKMAFNLGRHLVHFALQGRW